MIKNPFSHIDMHVTSFSQALPFYEKLLPALGFTETFHTAKWKVFAAEGELPSVAYLAITEDPSQTPNDNVVGFWAASREVVDQTARLIQEHGGKINAGPQLFPISASYYAVYFEDPCGNQYELLHRLD